MKLNKKIKTGLIFIATTGTTFLLLTLPINISVSTSTLLYCIATGICAYYITAYYAPKKQASQAPLDSSIKSLKKELEETKHLLKQTQNPSNNQANIDISIVTDTHKNEAYIINPDKNNPTQSSIMKRLVSALKKNGHPVKLLKPANPKSHPVSIPNTETPTPENYGTDEISIHFPSNLINYN